MFIFFKILFIFFWQIWCENRKFLKLTEISQRGTLLDAYYDLNVYFFKIFIIHNFGLIWSENLKFSKLTEIWCMLIIASCLLWFYVHFFQLFFQSYFFGKFGPKIRHFSNWLKFVVGVHYYNQACIRWSLLGPLKKWLLWTPL